MSTLRDLKGEGFAGYIDQKASKTSFYLNALNARINQVGIGFLVRRLRLASLLRQSCAPNA